MRRLIEIFQKPIVLILTICLLLLVPFIWKDPVLSIHRFRFQINDQKLTNYFTSLFAIIATVAAYYYYKRQLESSMAGYRPVIYPTNATISCEELFTDEIENTDRLPILEWEVKNPKSNGIRISNIGNGNAKNIKIEWKYNPLSVKEQIKDSYFDYALHPERLELENSLRASYLLKDKSTYVRLPFYYLLICGPRLFNYGSREGFRVPPIKSDLRLNIQYQDVQNNTYRQTFAVEILLVTDMYLSFTEEV